MKLTSFTSLTFACVLSIALAFPLQANSDPTQAPVDTVDSFLAKQEQLRRDIESGKYELSNRDKKRIRHAQSIIFGKLHGKSDLRQINELDFIDVVNNQELIVGILSGTEDDRMVCQRIHLVGSFAEKTVCMSKREMDARRRETRDELDWVDRMNRAY